MKERAKNAVWVCPIDKEEFPSDATPAGFGINRVQQRDYVNNHPPVSWVRRRLHLIRVCPTHNKGLVKMRRD